MYFKTHQLRQCCVVLFIALMLVGFFLAQRKVLWIDEFYTQKRSIDTQSYGSIMVSNITEGNKSPLFYIIQKTLAVICNYQLPIDQIEGLTRIPNSKLQILMRIPSNIFMSLALTAMFYFLATRFSLMTAVAGLVTAFVTPMIWQYWVEARPYSLWFLLTVLQLILVALLANHDKRTKQLLAALCGVHLALAFTTIGCIFQLFAVGLLLFVIKDYRRQLWWVAGVPLAIVTFYYVVFPTYTFKVLLFWSSFFDVIKPERISIILIYALSCLLGLRYKKFFFACVPILLGIYLLLVLGFSWLLATHLNEQRWQFEFYSRYFIFLVPLEIMLFSIAFRDFYLLANRYLFCKINIILLFIGLTFVRGLITYWTIISTATFSGKP